MRVPIASLAVILSGTAGALAQPAHTTRDAYACVDPNAVRALSNTAEPRRYDRDWVNYVVRKGNCGTLPAGTAVNKSGISNELSSVQVNTQGQSAQLYIQGTNLNLDPAQTPSDPPPSPVAAIPDPVPDPASGSNAAPESGDDLAKLVDKLRVEPRHQRSSWRFTRLDRGSGCQIDGFTKPGHTVIVASAEHPGVVRLVLQKTSWRIPASTPVSASMSFSDNGSIPLTGTGDGTEITFDLTEATLKPWLHGFTTSPTGKVSFTSGNEPAWKLDLSGTPVIVNTLRKCVVDAKLDVPPPLADLPTQPFSASNGPTQPFGVPSPVKPGTSPPAKDAEFALNAPPAPPRPVAMPPPARIAATQPVEVAPPAPPPPLAPLPASPPAPPAKASPAPTLSWNDIPRLKQEFDSSGGTFRGNADPVFSGQGVFLGFTTADAAEQGKTGLWMAIVDSATATEPNAFCLFTSYRSDLAQLKKGQPVRISGKVVVPMEGSIALERNCSVTPG